MSGFESRNFIAGEWPRPTGEMFERCDPADSRRVVSTAPESSRVDVAAAVDAASSAFPAWSRTTADRRSAILMAAAAELDKRAPELAQVILQETGKPAGPSGVEARRTPRNLELYAAEAIRLNGVTYPSDDTGTTVYSERVAVGVVGVITPWNFPTNLASRKIGPALAAGNTVVFKPSPMAPHAAQILVEALQTAGIPDGVINVVHGEAAGALLVEDHRVGAITFTGSTATGRRIHEASSPDRRLQLELGGNNPVVVLADADLEAAAKVVAASSFNLSGQACTGAGRILVADEVHDELIERVTAIASTFVVGDGRNELTTHGPLVDRRAQQAMLTVVADSVTDGAEVIFGGAAPSDAAREHGWFFEPTLLAGVHPTTPVAATEVFGPVVGVERVVDLDEAVARANATEYGLTSAVCTRSLAVAQEFARRVEAGTVRVNRPTVGAAFNAPFGGIKASSTGTHREQLGPTVMDFYTTLKTVFLGS